jgi:hypothetical protein
MHYLRKEQPLLRGERVLPSVFLAVTSTSRFLVRVRFATSGPARDTGTAGLPLTMSHAAYEESDQGLDGAANKPGGHELFERKRQLIFTDCCNHRFIKAVVRDLLIFLDFLERPQLIAEHDEIPDEVTCRFAHGLDLTLPASP